MKKILITGESGVIPTEICKLAALSGYVVVNTNLEPTLYDYLKKFQAFNIRKPEIDFTDQAIIQSAFEILKPDIVIHSGAFVGTDYCDAKKDMATIVNVYGTQNIVDLCNKHKIPLIYFSTTAIFDTHDYDIINPITEKTKINPQTLYGITKYAGELIVKNTCKTPYIIVRPVFGFGNYPNDLHSALTKFIYTTHAGQKNILKILLNPNIGKNYFRVENIAYCVLKLIEKDVWDITVNVGENYTERKNWFELDSMIHTAWLKTDDEFKTCPSLDEIEEIKISKSSRVIFDSNQDYLHWHNIDNSALLSLIGSEIYLTSLQQGIEKTLISVIENKNIEPYWI